MAGTVIMMYGYTGSGKSVVATRISQNLTKHGIKNIILKPEESSYEGIDLDPSGKFFEEGIEKFRELRDRAYLKLIKKAESLLSDEIVIILDASFSRLHRREWVYEICERHDSKLYIVWCECDDENEIRKRLVKRYLESKRADDLANSYKIYTYVKNQAEKLEDFEAKEGMHKIIYFNTLNYRLRFINCKESEKIAIIIKEACTEVAADFSKKGS